MTGHPILDFLGERLWALHPSTLEHLTGLLIRHAAGVKLDAADVDEIRTRRADGGDPMPRDARGYELRGNVAVIPLRGVVAKYAHQVNGSSQPRGIAAETVLAGLRAALDDQQVQGILLNIDSPGGTVSGVPALAEELLAARMRKPIWAHAQDLAASAAYWLGSQAERFYASRAANVGSIGVYAAVVDQSKAAENEGLRVHVVKAGEQKGIGVPGAPIGKADLEVLQAKVDETRDLFVEAIAAGRAQLTPDQARKLATGATWLAPEALELGLIDGVLSFEQTLEELSQFAAGDFEAQGTDAASDGTEGDHMDDEKQVQEHQADEAVAPSLEAATAAELKAANPQLVLELLEQGATQERERIAEIRDAALPGQEALAEELIASGAKPDDARKRFLEDAKGQKAAAAKELLEGAAELSEPVGSSEEPEPRAFAMPGVDELKAMSEAEVGDFVRASWKQHGDELRAEGFFGMEAFEGHLLAERARVNGKVL